MNRHMMSVLICLLLGAIVNVAVAWGLARSSTFGPPSMVAIRWLEPQTGKEPCSWFQGVSMAATGTRRVSYSNRVYGPLPHSTQIVKHSEFEDALPRSSRLPDWAAAHEPASQLNPVSRRGDGFQYRLLPDKSIVESYYGWPSLSMRRTHEVNDQPPIFLGSENGSDDTEGNEPFRARLVSFVEQWELPFEVLAREFLVNSVVYATFLWLALASPLVTRRAARRWRGLCINCAYDLRGTAHARCPECGAATPATPPASRTMSP